MAQFAMLLYKDPKMFAKASPAEMQAVLQAYVAWRQEMDRGGKLKAAQRLKEEGGKVLTRGVVADGPYAEAQEVIGGFYLVEAADYAEAVEIARSSPHARYGGRIEVREIDVRS